MGRAEGRSTLNNRGLALIDLEHYEVALPDYNRPDDPTTLSNLGWVLEVWFFYPKWPNL